MTMNLPHVANRVLNTPLLLEPGYARIFFNALSTRLGIRNLYDMEGRIESGEKLRVRAGGYDDDGSRAAEPRPYRLVDGVAVLPVSGTLVHKHGYLQPFSGMTGYDGIIARLGAALNDNKVKGVLLDLDTPGGEVAGCFDAARRIRTMSQEAGKEVWALCYDMNASGGMALASAADRRLITQTGIAGSVGVVMAHTSWEEYLEGEGVDVTLIYSGAHKVDGNPYQKLPEDVLADFQGRSDRLRLEFATLVSELTDMDQDAVLATEARCYRGQEAIDIGFADQLVNGNEAIALFAEYLSNQGTTLTTGGTTMSVKTEAPATATTTAAQPQAAQLEATEQVQPAASTDARQTERARIKAITGSDEAAGRMSLAEHLAYNTDMSVEDALATLAAAASEAAPQSSTSPLEAAMQTAASTAIGADTADADVDETASAVNRVMGNYNRATGRAQQ